MTTFRRCNHCGGRVAKGTRCGCTPQTAGGANERGYTYAWQQASRQWMNSHPRCGERKNGTISSDGCGRTVYRGKDRKHSRKGHVDHITPHGGDERLFWDEDNWQTLCAACHQEKTRRESAR